MTGLPHSAATVNIARPSLPRRALYLRFRGVGEGGERESVRRASSELLRFDSGRSLGRRAIDRGDEGKPLVGASHRRLAVFPMIRQLCADFLTRPSVCQSVPTCLCLPLEFPSQPGLPRATRIILRGNQKGPCT